MSLRSTLLLVVFLALTAACGGATGSGATGDAHDLQGRIVVQAAGGESEIKAIEEVADAFETANPGVEVEVVGVAQQGDHMARLATAFAGGDPPDVFLLNYRRFGQFAAKGVIEPADLGDLKRVDFYEAALEAFTFEGRTLCLPQNLSSTVVFFNPALFHAAGVALPTPGWSVVDLRRSAELLADAGIEAIGFETSFRTVPPFMWAAGAEVVDSTDKPSVISLNTRTGRAVLTYLKDLLVLGIDANEAAADPPEERFARGELAMFLDSRRAVPKFRKSQGLQFDVVPLPTSKAAATLLASDAYCVSKVSNEKALALAFARFTVGPEGGRVLAATGRTVPSFKALAESPAFLAPDEQPPSSRVWLDVVPTLRRLPNVGPWNQAEEDASKVLEQFFADKLSLDDTVRKIEEESRETLTRQ
ncbi:MAG: extracellular solute-binding protein [Nitriliruptorales bacterium]